MEGIFSLHLNFTIESQKTHYFIYWQDLWDNTKTNKAYFDSSLSHPPTCNEYREMGYCIGLLHPTVGISKAWRKYVLT